MHGSYTCVAETLLNNEICSLCIDTQSQLWKDNWHHDHEDYIAM